ncbi:MAG: hypothetical protein NT032_05540 [Actinobacteria bacterium]|nr:hypothetical protein [Actinomycetota bacterium]
MTTCHDSAISESMIGTAENKKIYLIIEQPGTWGQDALIESSLPEGFGQAIKDQINFPEVGVLLARRPDLGHQAPILACTYKPRWGSNAFWFARQHH